MKAHFKILIAIAAAFSAQTQVSAQSGPSGLVILDDTSVSNLGIEIAEVDYATFEETLFAIGRIEPIPARKSIVSTRIPGRIVKINAFEGDIVEANTTIVEIESLQPGNPPPIISLRSQLPGMIMKSHTHVGKPVVPESELFELMDLTEVYAIARIPEDQAGKLSEGSMASIRVAALGNATFNGELVRFGTEANPLNGTIDAYFSLSNPDYALRPHMRVEFSLIIDQSERTLSIPNNAIQSDGATKVVFVKDFDLANAYQKVPVQIGRQNDTLTEIKSGLFPGDQVVTKGAYPLLFAGGGGISLKEALDAAHGHEHNEDGSEMTAEDKHAAGNAGAHGAAGTGNSQLTLFLAILSTFLAVLLALSLAIRPKNGNVSSS